MEYCSEGKDMKINIEQSVNSLIRKYYKYTQAYITIPTSSEKKYIVYGDDFFTFSQEYKNTKDMSIKLIKMVSVLFPLVPNNILYKTFTNVHMLTEEDIESIMVMGELTG